MTTSRALRRRIAAAAGAIGFALTVAACNAAPTANLHASNAAATADETSTTTSTVPSTTSTTTPSSTTSTTAPAHTAPQEAHGDEAHVSGTVASVAASGFTVTGDDGTTTTSVTTTADTHFTKTAAATVADATVGSWIAGDATGIAVLPSAKGAFGKVTANDGTTITLSTKDGTKTITTTASTKVTKTTVVALADVTVGDPVKVEGDKGSDGTVTAERVDLGVKPAAKPGARPHDEHRGAAGTVASVSDSGFTLTTHDGKTVTVTTTSSTKFHKEGDGSAAASLADVKVGDKVAVEGVVADDGSITADVVHVGEPKHDDQRGDDHGGENQVRQGPDGNGGRPSRGGPGGGQRTNGGR